VVSSQGQCAGVEIVPSVFIPSCGYEVAENDRECRIFLGNGVHDSLLCGIVLLSEEKPFAKSRSLRIAHENDRGSVVA
jgi:hypothetical protein